LFDVGLHKAAGSVAGGEQQIKGMEMMTRKVAVAMVGIPERLLGVLHRVFDRSRTRSSTQDMSIQDTLIHYMPLASGGETEALVVLLGRDLKAPESSRWGRSVAAILPLNDLIDKAVCSGGAQHQPMSFSDLLRALDEICLRHFAMQDAGLQRKSDPARAGDASSRSAAEQALRLVHGWKRSNVLLVTDENRRVDETAFEGMAKDEIEFELAASPGEALRKSAQDDFDLAILDVDALEGQAYTLCRKLMQRRGDGRLKVLLMGQHRGVLEQWRGRWAGSEGLIPGPEEPEGFRAGVARVLQR
jgi:CheY-like chemotaxis protein